jgi:hypothetical protein
MPKPKGSPKAGGRQPSGLPGQPTVRAVLSERNRLTLLTIAEAHGKTGLTAGIEGAIAFWLNSH